MPGPGRLRLLEVCGKIPFEGLGSRLLLFGCGVIVQALI